MSSKATPKLRIKLKSFDLKMLESSVTKVLGLLIKSGADVKWPIPLPRKNKKYTVIKSHFVYKDSRDQYERITYTRLLDVVETWAKTVEYLQNMTLPAGVSVEVRIFTEKDEAAKAAKKSTATAAKASIKADIVDTKKKDDKKETKSEKKKPAKKDAAWDDFTKIEGIGPKINGLLHDAGMTTYADLAKADIDTLKWILSDAGSRYASHDPSTRADQSAMAADDKWDELKARQDELDGGKVK